MSTEETPTPPGPKPPDGGREWGETVNHIGERPTDEMYRSGLEIDWSCARCGSSIDSESCQNCEDGFDGHDCGEDCCACRYPEENVPCQYCDGTGMWHRCMSSPDWCQANPIPGREGIMRGQLEWYTIDRQEPTANE